MGLPPYLFGAKSIHRRENALVAPIGLEIETDEARAVQNVGVG